MIRYHCAFWPEHSLEYGLQALESGLHEIEIQSCRSYISQEEYNTYIESIQVLLDKGVGLTVHAPIIDINLGSTNHRMRRLSIDHIFEAIELALRLGASIVVTPYLILGSFVIWCLGNDYHLLKPELLTSIRHYLEGRPQIVLSHTLSVEPLKPKRGYILVVVFWKRDHAHGKLDCPYSLGSRLKNSVVPVRAFSISCRLERSFGKKDTSYPFSFACHWLVAAV